MHVPLKNSCGDEFRPDVAAWWHVQLANKAKFEKYVDEEKKKGRSSKRKKQRTNR
jgi:hypothetical protein